MAYFTKYIDALKSADKYFSKNNLMLYLLNHLNNLKIKLIREDVEEIAQYLLDSTEKVSEDLAKAQTYKEKLEIFEYIDSAVGIVATVFLKRDEVPKVLLDRLESLSGEVLKGRYLENEVELLFSEGANADTANKLVETVKGIDEEFHRGQLYNSLLAHQAQLKKLPDEIKDILSKFMAEEFQRYLDKKDDLCCESVDNMELECDVFKHFANDEIVELLYQSLKLKYERVAYYAVETLVSLGKTIPEDAIEFLCSSLPYAYLTYELFDRNKMDKKIPVEFCDEEYLAKSHLVHWLMYPTELGKEPETIECIGNIKHKKEVYYIFKFTSDSENLGEELYGKQLIGWASNAGDVYSEFNLLDEYEKKTPKKTLKHILKKLIK